VIAGRGVIAASVSSRSMGSKRRCEVPSRQTGETALVAPRRDVGALARALDRLVTDGELRERLARQGQHFITTRFDWERATTLLEGILKASSGATR